MSTTLQHSRIEPGNMALSRRLPWRGCRQLCIALLLCLLNTHNSPAAESRADAVWLLTGGEHPDLVKAFIHRLATGPLPQPKVRVIDTANGLDTSKTAGDAHPSALIIAIGSTAARLAHATPRTQPVLDILIPRQLYEQLSTVGTAQSALYIDQPLERQLNLCRLIVPEVMRLAVLYGPASRTTDSALRSSALRLGITVHARQVNSGSNPNAALDDVLDDSQLLLALPDPDVFNRYTVAGLLLTAYHHDVPVVGFSAAYVKAGALAAVFSTPEQIGRDAAEIVLAARTDAGWALPVARYPKYFEVAVNRQVGRSLNLKLRDDIDLKRVLEQQEHAQ